jgi:hypothetical protein
MKKYIKFKIFISVAFLALITVSCDENIDPDPIISTEGYPVATFKVSATTVSEKDGLVSVTITTDKMLTRGITFSAEQTGGTAVLHQDYDIVEAIVAPYSKEATLLVKFYDDIIPEPAKTLQLQITTPSLANRYLLNPKTVLPLYNITINNYVSNTLDIKLNYNKSFLDGTTAKTLCGIGYDIDFFVFDANYNDTGNYQAAASGCPELLTVSPAKFPNGTYHIFYDLWDNHGLSAMSTPEFTVPISVDYSRAGFISGTFNQEAKFAFTSKAPGYVQSANNEPFDYVVTIVVNNGTYTLKNSLGTTIANAKTSNKILAAIKHARLNNKK